MGPVRVDTELPLNRHGEICLIQYLFREALLNRVLESGNVRWPPERSFAHNNQQTATSLKLPRRRSVLQRLRPFGLGSWLNACRNQADTAPSIYAVDCDSRHNLSLYNPIVECNNLRYTATCLILQELLGPVVVVAVALTVAAAVMLAGVQLLANCLLVLRRYPHQTLLSFRRCVPVICVRFRSRL